MTLPTILLCVLTAPAGPSATSMSTNIFLIEFVRSAKPSTKNAFVFLANLFTVSVNSLKNSFVSFTNSD